MIAILGKKIGMTQYITAKGDLIPVTAVEAGPCVVTEVKNAEKHGYKAAQVGFGDNVKEKNEPKAYVNQFKKKNLAVKKYLREIRLTPQENYEPGQEIKADIFKPGDLVDVQGRSIGKGFAGGMKRWHWKGGPGSHGSMFHRRIGSAGASSFPSRTWPGHHMPGHLGNATTTVQNLEVLKVDAAKNLLLVEGSVPGAENGILFIRRSLKKPQGVKAKVKPVQVTPKNPIKAAQKAAGPVKKK